VGLSHPHKITTKIAVFGTVMIYHHDGGSRLLLKDWYMLNRPHDITPQKRATACLLLSDLNLSRFVQHISVFRFSDKTENKKILN
jgi:hypothetical protein